MKRLRIAPREDSLARCEEVGFDFHTINDAPYWDESVCYEFSATEVDLIDDATALLHRLALDTVDWVVRDGALQRLGIPAGFEDYVRRSWLEREPTLYGRMDLAYDGSGVPKLLEYNADTPTALLESAVVQWAWLKDTRPDADQFNSLHEKLIERLRGMIPSRGARLHFACDVDVAEDLGTVRYLADLALQAGAGEARVIAMDDIGSQPRRSVFVDRQLDAIENIFKLYPWEWMFAEESGALLPSRPGTSWLEPPWKALLSNKALLALMWERHPTCPFLLPAYLDPAPLEGEPYVAKPVHSREGANVSLVGIDTPVETDGPYSGPRVFQRYCPLFREGRSHAVIGSWIVGDQPAGMGIREDEGLVTTNASRFVPHYFREGGG